MTSGTWDRHRGHSDSYDVVDVGFNFRLDEPRAALGSSRLRRLPDDLETTRATAAAWADAVGGAAPAETPGAFPVLLGDPKARDRAVTALCDAGITGWAEPLLEPAAPTAREAAERLVVIELDSGVAPDQLARALRLAGTP